MTFWILSILLSLKPVVIVTFSSGAPLSACDGDMVPRHGFEAQAGDPPVELVMDQYTMVSDQYLRVTIRSKRAFKGFLIRADSDSATHLGTWYIPYLEDTSHLSESSYLHCQGRTQSAVTHSGRTNSMFLISLQWKPPADFYGWVSFRATVVENYRVYWLDVSASPVRVISKGDTAKDTPEYYEVSREVTSNKRTSYYNPGHGSMSTHKYDGVKNTMLLPREESTFSSILKEDERDLTVNNPDFTNYTDVQENDNHFNRPDFEHEIPHINENIDVEQKAPVDVTHDMFSSETIDVTRRSSQKIYEDIVLTRNKLYPSNTAVPFVTFTTEYSRELVSEETDNKEINELQNSPNNIYMELATQENSEATDTTLSIKTTTFVTHKNQVQILEATTKLKTENFTTDTTDPVTTNNVLTRILEPAFILTTDSPAMIYRHSNISTQNDIENANFLNLNGEGRVDTKIVKPDEHNDKDISTLNNYLLNTLLYTVEHNTEAENANTEDLTEVIIISNITKLDRMQRDNDGQGGEEFETLEGPYQRLQAQYGNWGKSGSKHVFFVSSGIIILLHLCL